MKGLLKAYIQPTDFQFDTARPNTPEHHGVTLAYVNICSQDLIDEFQEILDAVVGLTVSVELIERVRSDRATWMFAELSWPQEIRRKFNLPHIGNGQCLLKSFYGFHHHLTEGWNDGEAPIVAAKDTKLVEENNWVPLAGWETEVLEVKVNAKVEWSAF